MINSKPRLLYLEDEAYLALAVTRHLSGEDGFDVCCVQSLAAAERALLGPRMDLALMDVQLAPGETSLPLAQRLMRDGVPVVLTSGLSTFPPGWPLDVPLPRFIDKPYDMDRLPGLLRAALGGPADAP